jgi:hypothetical protein
MRLCELRTAVWSANGSECYTLFVARSSFFRAGKTRATTGLQPSYSLTVFLNSDVFSIFRKARLLRAAFVFCAAAGSAVVFLSAVKQVRAAAPSATPEEQAVLEPIQRLFDGLAKPDEGAIRAQLIPEGSATLYRNGQFLQMSLSALADRLGKIINSGPDRFEERIHDPLIRIDDNIAVVWAPYEALKNGKLDHCGTNLFNLVHRDGRWLIASFTDNSRNCAAK